MAREQNGFRMSKKINIITLGCAKNVVDSEHIMAQLAAGGWEVSHDGEEVGGSASGVRDSSNKCDSSGFGNAPDARVVVINTCGFIGDAKEESIDMILRYARAREEGLIDRLYVIGCLSERYRNELRAEISEVDEFFGVRDIGEIVRELTAEGWRGDLTTERVLTTPPH